MHAFTALAFPELSPFVFVIPEFNLFGWQIGPLPLRWYAVSYLIGITGTFYYGSQILKRPKLFGGVPSPVQQADLDEILTWVLVGIILGGRLGYILFYQLPFEPDVILQDPLALVRIWDGGLSFHGGFIGVCLAIYLVSRARKVSLLSFADIGGMTTPITIFSVRILGNFMNAELYGRETDASIGMIFPRGIAENNYGPPLAYDAVEKAWVYLGTEMPRHPSQIYEGLLEGLIPFLVLWVLAWRYKILARPGLAAGLFFILYGIGRTISEFFREPDAHIGFLPGGITMGMLLSLPMWLGGAWFVWNALKSEPLKAQSPA